MAKIVRDDGSWVSDPSGATSGDLQAWRDRMYQESPNPNAGDIVIVLHAQQGKRTGYRELQGSPIGFTKNQIIPV